MNKTNANILTALRLIKGEDILIVGLAVFFAGSAAAGSWIPDERLHLVILACVFSMLGVAGVNSLNQIHDLDIDRINKPKRPLPASINSVIFLWCPPLA